MTSTSNDPSNDPDFSVEIEGIKVHFPFKPYDIQEDFMRQVILCAKNVSFKYRLPLNASHFHVSFFLPSYFII